MIPEGLHPGEPLASTQALGCPPAPPASSKDPLGTGLGSPSSSFFLPANSGTTNCGASRPMTAASSSLWMTPRGLGTSSQRPWTAPRKPSCPAWTRPPPCLSSQAAGPSGAPLCPAVSGDSQTPCCGPLAMRWAAPSTWSIWRGMLCWRPSMGTRGVTGLAYTGLGRLPSEFVLYSVDSPWRFAFGCGYDLLFVLPCSGNALCGARMKMDTS